MESLARLGESLTGLLQNPQNLQRNKTTIHTAVSLFQLKCTVYACFGAKMLEMAFMCFGGQVQFEKSMVGKLDNSATGPVGQSVIEWGGH